MKSPFPGMDPYIEGHGRLWEDFHRGLIAEIHASIAKQLPERFAVRGEYRAYVVLNDNGDKKQHGLVADLGLYNVGRPEQAPAPGGSVVVAEPALSMEPQTLRAFVAEEYREAFLEIYEVEPEWRLVTGIEVLSPSNKRPETPGWVQYTRKRQALLMGEANFVEIDLLRGGTRMPMLDPWPNSPYTLLVARREKAPSCKVWPAHYRLPLPAIPVPLTAPHPDVTLELQPLVEAVYARSRYDYSIDYSKPLSPPLSEGEAAWLAQRLSQRGP
jgi:hypothetical protein